MAYTLKDLNKEIEECQEDIKKTKEEIIKVGSEIESVLQESKKPDLVSQDLIRLKEKVETLRTKERNLRNKEAAKAQEIVELRKKMEYLRAADADTIVYRDCFENDPTYKLNVTGCKMIVAKTIIDQIPTLKDIVRASANSDEIFIQADPAVFKIVLEHVAYGTVNYTALGAIEKRGFYALADYYRFPIEGGVCESPKVPDSPETELKSIQKTLYILNKRIDKIQKKIAENKSKQDEKQTWEQILSTRMKNL